MGGCASKPKEADLRPDTLPAEPPQGNNNGGEGQNEAPLVDLSEPKQEGASTETAAAEVGDLTANTEEKAEVVAKESEDKVEAGTTETKEPEKEGQDEANAVKSEVAPSSEDKSDAPLVTV